ncbi:MAG: shikimate kinase [Pseudanabaenaceae cyanobacterium SKYGB_i_bin29]|nr:shikimate kinase [Pseudanabaenaceae cyanobacterium SKYG29]MDW8420341.1 shikimate kinase [Pseudanabaenaceae cyanobacterium SKYGB_i_bin29]
MLLRGVNLFLVGMMGSGKSTVGKLLAPQLRYRFVDTDSLIEAYAQKSISAIFQSQGEAYFRELESQVLQEVCAHSRLVVATGGGIVMSDRNWSYLHHGVVVWLDVPVEELWQRLSHSAVPRPLLHTPDPQATLQTIWQQRRHRYAQADVHVTATGDPKTVAQAVIRAVIDRITPANQYRGDNTSRQNGCH